MTTDTLPHRPGMELLITRTFDAPRELVWQAWTEPGQARAWWGPHDFSVPELELASHPGEPWRAVMRSPDGATYPQHGVLVETTPPERLGFTLIWDNDGSQHEMLVSITLVAVERQTAMTFRKGPFRSAVARWGEEEGWNEAFDRLAAFLRRPH